MDALRRAFELEDGAGSPVRLRVPGPLPAHAQRLMDSLGVEVSVQVANAVTRCPQERCTWNFVGTEEKAKPYLEAHLRLMHGGARPVESAAADEAAEVLRDLSEAFESVEPKRRGGPIAKWTPETVIDALRVWADEHGRAPKTTDAQKRGSGLPDPAHALKFFGGWKALVAAAFPDDSSGEGAGSRGAAVPEVAVPSRERPVTHSEDIPSSAESASPEFASHFGTELSSLSEPVVEAIDDSAPNSERIREAPPVSEILTFEQLVVAGHAMEAIASQLRALDKPDRRAVWAFVRPLIEEALAD